MSELSVVEESENLLANGDNMNEVYPPDYQDWLDKIDKDNDDYADKGPPF
jgi:hypothetical protein